jgi:hypothetical protein
MMMMQLLLTSLQLLMIQPLCKPRKPSKLLRLRLLLNKPLLKMHQLLRRLLQPKLKQLSQPNLMQVLVQRPQPKLHHLQMQP